MARLIAMGVEQEPANTGASKARKVSRQREAGEVTRRETRRRLLAAARLEFAERGYIAATVARIAERAGVSLQSLYSAWGNKRALLRAVMETAVTGEDDPDSRVEFGQAPAPFAVALSLDDSKVDDAHVYLREVAHQFRLMAERSAVAWQNYRDAAAVDPEAAADWQQLMEIRRANIGVLISRLPQNALRAGLTPAAATDTVWIIASPDTHDMLVRRGGYSYDALEEWVRTTLDAAILAPPDR